MRWALSVLADPKDAEGFDPHNLAEGSLNVAGVDNEKLPAGILHKDGGVDFPCADGFSKTSVTLAKDTDSWYSDMGEDYYTVEGDCGTLTTVDPVDGGGGQPQEVLPSDATIEPPLYEDDVLPYKVGPYQVGVPCVFPFTFFGKKYWNCAPMPRGIDEVAGWHFDNINGVKKGRPWCSTKTDAVTGEHVADEGQWGYCPRNPENKK